MKKITNFSGKKLLLLVVVGFVIYFLASKWVGLDKIFVLLENADIKFIILAVILEIFAYLGSGFLIHSILNNLNFHLSYSDSFKLGTVTAMAVHILPVAGFGEAAVNYYYLRQKGAPTGNIFALLLTRLIFSYSAFFIILGIGLIFVPAFADVSLAGKLAAIIVLLMLVGGIIFARTLYLNYNRFRVVFGKVIGWLDKVKKSILNRKRLSKEQTEAVLKDIHDGFSPMDNPGEFFKQTFIATFYWLGDMGVLFLVVLSLGHFVHPVKIIIAYSIAIVLGAISFIPGGLGIIEGALGLMLVNIGLPINVAIMSVIGYRLISFWLMIPVGVISATQISKNTKQAKTKK